MNPKRTVEDLKSIAKQRGGFCHATTYTNALSPVLWECKRKHKWYARPNSVISSNQWCRKCAYLDRTVKRNLTIKDMNLIARKREGACLSKRYINIKSKLRWQCKNNHKWFASADSIFSGRWCPTCSMKAPKSISFLRSIAQNRHGKLLSKTYLTSKTQYKWQCKYGHQWKARYTNILSNNSWCPQCAGGQGEELIRAYFEKMFGSSFPKARPPWLRNADGNQMELDGFSHRFALAFEYNGRQHYQTNKRFGGAQGLKKRLKDDRRKMSLCKRHDVSLIVVPEIGHILKKDRLATYLFRSCLKLGFSPKKIKSKVNIYHDKANHHLMVLGAIAKKNRGKLLSTQYEGAEHAYFWKCRNGHTWRARAYNVKTGTWCPHCAKTKIGTIAEMRAIARDNAGKCLSKRYLNKATKLRWICKKQHTWMATPASVKKGSWCPTCRHKQGADSQRSTIKQMSSLAKKHGGSCLSKTYVNARTKLSWKCRMGHIFQTTPTSIISKGTWCPKCGIIKRSNSQRLTITEMARIAKQRGGTCLSTNYVNNRTKLALRCKIGHRWMATPSSLKAGSWCPVCHKNK